MLADYRLARNIICEAAAAAPTVPNEELLAEDKLYDPNVSAQDRAHSLEAGMALADRFGATADLLEAISAPPQLAAEHVASVTRARDVVTLLERLFEHLEKNELIEARTLDGGIGLINLKIEAFEQKYALSGCP